MPDKIFLSWSGGKDSSLALYKTRQQGLRVDALLTSVNSFHNRISMHGVRRVLLERQAELLDLPLYTLELPEQPGMDQYESELQRVNNQLKNDGFTQGIFGDIFLEDLKQYREEQLAKYGLGALFPLWRTDGHELMKHFISAGFKALIVCINSTHLDKDFCGRLIDESFVKDLPANVDVCGENGEYHSFVFDGPIFRQPVLFKKGEMVYKEYDAPFQSQACKSNDDNNRYVNPAKHTAGFYFQDLIPV